MRSSPDVIFETLMLVPWIASAGTDVARALASGSQLRNLVQGSTVSWRGQPLTHLTVIADGQLETSQTNVNGRQHVAGLLTRGMVFGLIPVLDERPAIHNALARTACQVVTIPRDTLLDQMQKSPQLMRGTLNLLCARSRHLHDLLADQRLHSTSSRIARLLLQLASAYGNQDIAAGAHPMVQVTQGSMADMLGLTRQSLNTELKKLETSGVVRTAYSRIELRDLKVLKSLAGPDNLGHH